MIDARKVARKIESQLESVGTPERAAGEKRYLKSHLTFLGATLGQIRAVTKADVRANDLGHDDAVALATELWRKPVFERRMAAVIVLELRSSALGPQDLAPIERFIRESKTWALVDSLAGDVVGEISLHHKIKQRLDRWAKDDDFWIRRSSLLAELKPLKKGAPFEPFAKRADDMLEETEFFIRKAIGWVLRETSKKRPDLIYGWIAPRTHRASGVTMRETVKYLEPRLASELIRAYKEGRPAAR